MYSDFFSTQVKENWLATWRPARIALIVMCSLVKFYCLTTAVTAGSSSTFDIQSGMLRIYVLHKVRCHGCLIEGLTTAQPAARARGSKTRAQLFIPFAARYVSRGTTLWPRHEFSCTSLFRDTHLPFRVRGLLGLPISYSPRSILTHSTSGVR
jgi:hypothetical protein